MCHAQGWVLRVIISGLCLVCVNSLEGDKSMTRCTYFVRNEIKQLNRAGKEESQHSTFCLVYILGIGKKNTAHNRLEDTAVYCLHSRSGTETESAMHRRQGHEKIGPR